MDTTTEDDAELQKILGELQSVEDPGLREDLLVRLAECALRLHDFTDHEVPNHVQDAFSELRSSQMHYQLAALRVARYMMQYLKIHDDDDDDDDDDGALIIPLGPAESPN
jgi:hypothetical protein